MTLRRIIEGWVISKFGHSARIREFRIAPITDIVMPDIGLRRGGSAILLPLKILGLLRGIEG